MKHISTFLKGHTIKDTLTTHQEKLKLIDKLTNCIQKADTTTLKDNIAYFIHELINTENITTDQYRKVQHYQIETNKELFINIK